MSAGTPFEQGQRGARDEVKGIEIGADVVFPIGRRGAHERFVREDPGIVHQNVKALVPLLNFPEKRGHSSFVRNIRGKRGCSRSPHYSFAKSAVISGHESQLRAFPGAGFRYRSPDSAACARDDNNAARKARAQDARLEIRGWGFGT